MNFQFPNDETLRERAEQWKEIFTRFENCTDTEEDGLDFDDLMAIAEAQDADEFDPEYEYEESDYDPDNINVEDEAPEDLNLKPGNHNALVLATDRNMGEKEKLKHLQNLFPPGFVEEVKKQWDRRAMEVSRLNLPFWNFNQNGFSSNENITLNGVNYSHNFRSSSSNMSGSFKPDPRQDLPFLQHAYSLPTFSHPYNIQHHGSIYNVRIREFDLSLVSNGSLNGYDHPFASFNNSGISQKSFNGSELNNQSYLLPQSLPNMPLAVAYSPHYPQPQNQYGPQITNNDIFKVPQIPRKALPAISNSAYPLDLTVTSKSSKEVKSIAVDENKSKISKKESSSKKSSQSQEMLLQESSAKATKAKKDKKSKKEQEGSSKSTKKEFVEPLNKLQNKTSPPISKPAYPLQHTVTSKSSEETKSYADNEKDKSYSKKELLSKKSAKNEQKLLDESTAKAMNVKKNENSKKGQEGSLNSTKEITLMESTVLLERIDLKSLKNSEKSPGSKIEENPRQVSSKIKVHSNYKKKGAETSMTNTKEKSSPTGSKIEENPRQVPSKIKVHSNYKKKGAETSMKDTKEKSSPPLQKENNKIVQKLPDKKRCDKISSKSSNSKQMKSNSSSTSSITGPLESKRLCINEKNEITQAVKKLTIDDVSTAGSSLDSDDDDFIFGPAYVKDRRLKHRMRKLKKRLDEKQKPTYASALKSSPKNVQQKKKSPFSDDESDDDDFFVEVNQRAKEMEVLRKLTASRLKNLVDSDSN